MNIGQLAICTILSLGMFIINDYTMLLTPMYYCTTMYTFVYKY